MCHLGTEGSKKGGSCASTDHNILMPLGPSTLRIVFTAGSCSAALFSWSCIANKHKAYWRVIVIDTTILCYISVLREESMRRRLGMKPYIAINKYLSTIYRQRHLYINIYAYLRVFWQYTYEWILTYSYLHKFMQTYLAHYTNKCT